MESRETRIDMIADLLARENVSRAVLRHEATEIFEIATYAIANNGDPAEAELLSQEDIDGLVGQMIDLHGVDRSPDAEAKRIDDAYERSLDLEQRRRDQNVE